MPSHPLLGTLAPHPDVEEWLQSEPVAVPLLNGQRLRVIFFGVDSPAGELSADEAAAVTRFFGLGAHARDVLAPLVFDNYREFVEAIGEEEFDFRIESAADVWARVNFQGIHVERDKQGDNAVYVVLAGECDWEIEHGIQIVLREGWRPVRISGQDGCLL